MAARPEPTRGIQFQIEDPPAPLLRWHTVAPVVLVALGCLLAIVIYWPALGSPPFGDDYIYLRAARDLSFADFAKAAITPQYQGSEILLTDRFWRPLYFLSFKALWPIFHGHMLPYHLLLLAVHFGTVLMTWALAKRLLRSAMGASLAALIVAVHPAGVDSIAWVSSLNSVAVPLMLGAWLAFAAAAESDSKRRRWQFVTLSTVLCVAALGFRETAVAIVPVIVAWYLCCPARTRLYNWRAYLPLLPLVALIGLHAVIRTRFFTAPFADEFQYQWGRHMVSNSWELLRFGPAPFNSGISGARALTSNGAGVAIIALGAWAAISRRWLLFALFLAFGLSLAPFAPLAFGLDRRYFYFAAPFFAIFAVQAAIEVRTVLPEVVRAARALTASSAVFIALVVIGGVVLGNDRVRDWAGRNPGSVQKWVDQLRATYPTLPAGGTLYCVDTPVMLALFGGYSVPPTVKYLYPQVGDAKYVERANLAAVGASLGPNDRIFIYKPGPN